jgi:DNA-binding CsgD family transcriptional regulator
VADDISRLRHPAGQLPDPWTRSCATEDAGVLHALAGKDDEAARAFDEALAEYARLGAGKRCGAHPPATARAGDTRRHWGTGKRPAAGWQSLTGTELAASSLVSHGLTNQQIAGQLFISTHTVAFHLRQVFRKLDIKSRVELIRIALEPAGAGGEAYRPASMAPNRSAAWVRWRSSRKLPSTRRRHLMHRPRLPRSGMPARRRAHIRRP